MKNAYWIFLLGLAFTACDNAPEVSKRPIDNTNKTLRDRQKETVAAHTLDKERETNNLPDAQLVEKSDKKTRWTRSGDPIDTSKYDEEIAAAEKGFRADSNDSNKKTLADAFFKRGFALTQARQYASAVGDYRKALKYDAGHAESNKWIASIAGIYKSLNREIPKEGEEPPPLEFKKKTS